MQKSLDLKEQLKKQDTDLTEAIRVKDDAQTEVKDLSTKILILHYEQVINGIVQK